MALAPPPAWAPTADEVRRIVDEMRPIIQDFARRSRQPGHDTYTAQPQPTR